ncbi:hypothetical protein [Polyangium aurulentum]|uniref:hypothetical protein n=1 Tax=Polyangium aurulentum TaxID=2567896 RepID=UPI0010AE6FC0|nr:hypothetical protein [Polyangium aurulentum]UQA60736.1 hypothetical protein E8A73_009745 [Polyangium aurulentum]
MAHPRLTSRSIARRALSLAALALFASSCGAPAKPSSPPSPAAPPPQPSARPAAVDPIAAGTGFEAYRSARFNLVLPLPDAEGWRIDDRGDRWLAATHAASSSALLMRTWREDEVVRRASCEERARLWRKLPEREGSRLLEARALPMPAEHDTIAEVRLRPSTKTEPAQGFVLAFGGWAKRCFAFVFVTRAPSERAAAERLATMVDGSLTRIRFESELSPEREERVVP